MTSYLSSNSLFLLLEILLQKTCLEEVGAGLINIRQSIAGCLSAYFDRRERTEFRRLTYK